jgi:hypothetical protein
VNAWLRKLSGMAMFGLAFSLVPAGGVFGQDGRKELRDWLAARLGAEKAADALLAKSEEFIKAKQDRERMSLTLGSALAGDVVEGKLSRSLVNVDARANRGIYPDELDFRFSSLVEVQDGDFKEYVSAMQLSYERYILPSVELFGFFERFSDAFLHLDQRYEVGLGMKLERNLLDRSQDVFIALGNHRAALEELSSGLLAEYAAAMGLSAAYAGRGGPRTCGAAAEAATGFYRRLDRVSRGNAPSAEEWLALCAETMAAMSGEDGKEPAPPAGLRPPEQLPAATPILMERLEGRAESLRLAWRRLGEIMTLIDESRLAQEKASAKVSWGVSAALFYEADRARAAWRADEGFFSDLDPVTLPSEQRFRLSVRPSFTWRPLPGLSFDVKYYFKLPVLYGLRKTSLLDGKSRLDVRHDARFALSYVHPKPVWAARVGLAFEYNYAFDSVPSYLDEDVVRENILTAPAFSGATLDDILAALQKARRHGQAKLSLVVAF